jgi:CBS domain-containing protein
MHVHKVPSLSADRLSPTTSIREAAARMKRLDVGALPVYEGERLMGMVTDHDIAVRSVADGRDPEHSRVREIMSVGVSYCFDNEDIDEAASIMRKKRIHQLLILNRLGRLVGMVSLDEMTASAEGRPAPSVTLRWTRH